MTVKSVLMVGGGVQQTDAVRVAREAGFRVIVSDRSADAPAAALADEAWQVDGLDAAELVRRARADGSVAAVFTLTELVETVAEVTRALDLRGASPEAARACQDKGQARFRLGAAGVPVPRGVVTRSADAALDFAEHVRGEVFVKPARGSGARGAGRVREPGELAAAFARAAEVAEEVVVEERVDGTHHDVNVVLDADGHVHDAGVADREFDPEHPVELGASAPTALDEFEREQAVALTASAARALGVEVGPAKADLVRNFRGLHVLEVAPRLHGPKGTLGLLPAAFGFEPLAGALRALVGDDPREALTPTRRRAAAYVALEAEPGVLERYDGVEEALAQDGVLRVWTLAAPGRELTRPVDASGVPGYVLAVGPDRDAARARAAAARDAIRVVTR